MRHGCTGTTPPSSPRRRVVPPIVTPPPSGTAVTLKVLQYNTHHGGYGSDGVYSMDRIADWIIKSDADLVSLNEIEKGDSWSKNQDQSVLYKQPDGAAHRADVVHGLRERARRDHRHRQRRAVEVPDHRRSSTQLLSAGRAAVDAMVDVNGRTVNFTSVHMDNQYQSNRLKETAELLPWELGLPRSGSSAATGTRARTTTEIANMKATYGESWPAAKALGTAIGNGITHGSHQIDYIFYSKSASHLTLVSSQIYKTADANGVTPSDHEPILAVFEVR